MKPRLSIRTFIVLCMLLGAVAIPVAWRQFQKWKADKVEALEKELAELRSELKTLTDPPAPTSDFDAAMRAYERAMLLALDPKAKAAHDQKVAELRQRITKLANHLEEITGNRRGRPQQEETATANDREFLSGVVSAVRQDNPTGDWNGRW